MKKLIVIALLLLARPALAQIAVDATGTCQTHAAATSATYTGITVGSGLSNGALLAFVQWGLSVTTPTATWGSQTMTLLGNVLGAAAVPNIAIFGLVNPASGNNNLLAGWTGNRNGFICAQSYSGVLQTGGTTTWPNLVTGSTIGVTTKTATVTSATSHQPTAMFSAVATVTSVNNTQIYNESVANDMGAANFGAGAASVALTANFAASTTAQSIGIDMVNAVIAAVTGKNPLPLLGVGN